MPSNHPKGKEINPVHTSYKIIVACYIHNTNWESKIYILTMALYSKHQDIPFSHKKVEFHMVIFHVYLFFRYMYSCVWHIKCNYLVVIAILFKGLKVPLCLIPLYPTLLNNKKSSGSLKKRSNCYLMCHGI